MRGFEALVVNQDLDKCGDTKIWKNPQAARRRGRLYFIQSKDYSKTDSIDSANNFDWNNRNKTGSVIDIRKASNKADKKPK